MRYLAAGFFFGSLGFNYRQHRKDNPTICSGFLRPTLHTETKAGKVLTWGLWGLLTAWILPHLTSERNQHHMRPTMAEHYAAMR